MATTGDHPSITSSPSRLQSLNPFDTNPPRARTPATPSTPSTTTPELYSGQNKVASPTRIPAFDGPGDVPFDHEARRLRQEVNRRRDEALRTQSQQQSDWASASRALVAPPSGRIAGESLARIFGGSSRRRGSHSSTQPIELNTTSEQSTAPTAMLPRHPRIPTLTSRSPQARESTRQRRRSPSPETQHEPKYRRFDGFTASNAPYQWGYSVLHQNPRSTTTQNPQQPSKDRQAPLSSPRSDELQDQALDQTNPHQTQGFETQQSLEPFLSHRANPLHQSQEARQHQIPHQQAPFHPNPHQQPLLQSNPHQQPQYQQSPYQPNPNQGFQYQQPLSQQPQWQNLHQVLPQPQAQYPSDQQIHYHQSQPRQTLHNPQNFPGPTLGAHQGWIVQQPMPQYQVQWQSHHPQTYPGYAILNSQPQPNPTPQPQQQYFGQQPMLQSHPIPLQQMQLNPPHTLNPMQQSQQQYPGLQPMLPPQQPLVPQTLYNPPEYSNPMPQFQQQYPGQQLMLPSQQPLPQQPHFNPPQYWNPMPQAQQQYPGPQPMLPPAQSLPQQTHFNPNQIPNPAPQPQQQYIPQQPMLQYNPPQQTHFNPNQISNPATQPHQQYIPQQPMLQYNRPQQSQQQQYLWQTPTPSAPPPGYYYPQGY